MTYRIGNRRRAAARWMVVVAPVFWTGCAVGPSTAVTSAVPAVTVRTPPAMSPTASAARRFLDSVTTARDTDRPDAVSRPLWGRVPLAVESGREIAWLDVLRDSQLVALVRTAVANNRDVRIAQARVREYHAALGVARSPLFPQLTGNATGGHNKVAFGAAAPIAYDAVRVTADLSWELDFWGRLRRQTQAADFDAQGREEDTRATVLTLIGDVATAYLQLQEVDANLHIAEQTLASRQSTLDLARRRFVQGIISELDVRQFEAQVAEPAARVADFARQRIERENALALLLGESPTVIPHAGNLADVVQGITIPDSLPGALIARRPDVLRAQRDWQAAQARVGVALASRFPAVTLTGQYGTQQPKFDGLFTPQGEVYTVQAGVSLPLFTGGRLRGTQQVAEARAAQAQGMYEQTVLIALREANDALAGVRFGRDQLVAQETQTRALETAYAIAQRRYESGISSYLEVLDAQRSLFTAQLGFVQVERQYLVAVVQLYKAIGGSWR